MGRCVSGGNARAYFLFLLSLLKVITFFHLSILESIPYHTDHFFFRVPCQLLCLFHWSKIMFLLVVLPYVPVFYIGSQLLWIVFAIGRKITVKELESAHKYKYLFKVRELRNEPFFVHKEYALIQQVKNFLRFIWGRDKAALKSQERYREQVFQTSQVSTARSEATEGPEDQHVEFMGSSKPYKQMVNEDVAESLDEEA